MTSTEAVARLVDITVDAILAVDPADLPLHGKHWTLRIDDPDIVLRISAVNATPQPRKPPAVPKPPSPPPKDGK